MALYHKWDIKNGFAYVLQFFSLISDGLGGVIEDQPVLFLFTSAGISNLTVQKTRMCPFFLEQSKNDLTLLLTTVVCTFFA